MWPWDLNCGIRIYQTLQTIELVAALYGTNSVLLVPISKMGKTVIGFKLAKSKLFLKGICAAVGF